VYFVGHNFTKIKFVQNILFKSRILGNHFNMIHKYCNSKMIMIKHFHYSDSSCSFADKSIGKYAHDLDCKTKHTKKLPVLFLSDFTKEWLKN